MSHPIRSRSRLLMGCGRAAMALALAIAPQTVQAQAINGSGTVVQGSAIIIDSPGQTTVDVVSPTAVINWTPTEDAGGNALDFLPTNTTALFRSGQLTNFAVLNRILPSTNGNIVVIDGTVLSRVTDPATGASIPGGFVAFYSPTGILVGSNATFDVGRLLLTTLDTTDASFQSFAEFGGNLSLTGATGSTARIQINPGAQITATAENSFFAVVAADVQMLGTARINGSHAYVAGEVVNLSFSNGLFDISVPVGTAASGNVMRLDGDVGGPSSNAAGDNHMIYALATAQADPISMIFRGNLGFDPAQSAGIINGEIILSANHDISGRVVDGGFIGAGEQAIFRANSATSDVQADIFVEDFAASSSLLAISTHRTRASAVNTASSVAGNLLIVGRENAELTAANGQDFTITGSVLVSAQDYGVASSTLQSLDVINAQGGAALIDISGGATLNIAGSAQVVADAFAGADTLNLVAGTAQGGQAQIVVTSGTLDIGNSAAISAGGVGTTVGSMQTGATSRGGLAQLTATQGGNVSLGFFLGVYADATGAQGSQFSPSTVSDAFGGDALVSVSTGGSLTAGFGLIADASARGGSSNNAGAGSLGDAGVATANVDGTGQIDITGIIRLAADGFGGENAGGTGGTGRGGRASAATFGGGSTIGINGEFNASAYGAGGDGQTGGDGFGGIAGANAVLGSITISQNAFAFAFADGGSATSGFGGNGGVGRGGNAFFQADGTLTTAASLTIIGNATVSAEGYGGNGGASDDDLVPAGRGGDGYGGQFAVPNQADPTRGSGAFLLAGGDNGTLNIGGTSSVFASGGGGEGGSGGNILNGGTGGDAFGGLAQVGLALFGQDGSLGQGSTTFGTVFADASAFGGSGGFSINDFPTGDGGNATGGDAFLTVRAGDITADQIDLTADGTGGDGTIAGIGRGGQAALFGSLGGSLTANRLGLSGQGLGGFAGIGTGGSAFGGLAAIEGDGISVTINGNALINASGIAGSSDDGAGGDATGGEAYVATVTANTPGTITITGHTQVFASALGGNTLTGFAGGDGSGGLAYVEALGGSTITLGSAQVFAVGRGGSAQTHESGDGLGGVARLSASGAGSVLNILRNVPVETSTNFDTLGGIATLNADGIGDITNGGDGIGGVGRGGTAEVIASTGGSINLPANVANDPNAIAPNVSIFARGIGGGSTVEGGTGGAAFGGNLNILVDGGTLVATVLTPSVFSQGGNSEDPASNISGGNATGGTSGIRVLNGGTLSLETSGGGLGAVGGNGSGTGNGGSVVAGNVLFEVINATANLVGNAVLFNQAGGGNGQVGGNATGGLMTVNLDNAVINLLPDAGGAATLGVVGDVQGGTGVTAGGNAQGNSVNITSTGSTITGGRIEVLQSAFGGSASDANGVGGTATGGQLVASFTNTDLALRGETLFAADAFGGSSGLAATGGSATSGTVDVSFTGTTISIVNDPQGIPGILRLRSQASGGGGATTGNATSSRAALIVDNSTLSAANISVEARGFADTEITGAVGGSATGGQARFTASGNTQVTTDLIEINSNAVTSAGGTARGGESALLLSSGSTATVNAASVIMLADASGGTAGTLANTAGRFSVNIGGGNLNAGSLSGSAFGDALAGTVLPSELVASGGNVNVTNSLSTTTFGDLLARTGGGGIIGSAATAGTTTAVQMNARGTIQILGDGSAAGGLGGQTINLQAGRSILVGGNLAARDGAITLAANLGGGQVLATPPVSVITMAQGSRINAGTGTVTVHLLDGAGDPQRVNGAINLASITGGLIDVRNFGTNAGSNIGVLANGVLTASGTGRAIDLASLGGEVINLAGDAGLVLTGGGHYGIFAATPTGSQIGSFANYARRYNVATAVAYDALNPGGNFAAFRIAPVITVSADNATRFYGDANPLLTASYAGFQPGDGVANLTGAPLLTTAATGTSNVGVFAIDAALGSLLSDQGYQFVINPGLLTITPRPIIVTATSLSRLYGTANPALTFSIGGLGLVNGDQLTGALATTAGTTTGVGNVLITQGSLAASANYALTFINGQLTITPRLLTVVADDLFKLLGERDPALTFTLSGDGLVNGDQLTGGLMRDPGEAVATFAIRQGTLTAGANYAITFVEGALRIDAPPYPPEITSQTLVKGPFLIGKELRLTLEEEQQRFGLDFPERPEAPLISEDPLLDEPVTSGADASLYSGGTNPEPRGEEQ